MSRAPRQLPAAPDEGAEHSAFSKDSGGRSHLTPTAPSSRAPHTALQHRRLTRSYSLSWHHHLLPHFREGGDTDSEVKRVAPRLFIWL